MRSLFHRMRLLGNARILRVVAMATLKVQAAFLLASNLAQAEQYRSEVREIAPPPEQQVSSDPATLLKSTRDPYARALLLRDMAATAAAKKDYAKAQTYLQQALATKALSGPAAELMQKDLAALALATGDLKSQRPQLEALVASGHATAQVRVALGAAYLQEKRYRDAIPHLVRGIEESGAPERSWRQALVSAYVGAGEDRKAAGLLERLLREEPADDKGWLQLSALYLKSGEKLRAQATMEIAEQLGYLTTVEQRLGLISLTGQIGAPFEAASVLQGWMKRQLIPEGLANQQLLAALWVRAREPQLALKVLNTIAAARPSRGVYEQMAQLHLEQEDYTRASQALSQALDLGKPSGELLMSLGLARYQLADVEGASNAFSRAAEFASQKKLASDWLRYLESGRAREQALAAAAQAQRRQASEVTLSDRMLGQGMRLADAAPEGVSDDDLDRKVASSLTPVGAEQSANADGSIPAWTGGILPSQWPVKFRKGAHLENPYAADKPLFTITANNVDRYKDRLSKGHRELIRQRPGYRMPVYPSRRSVSYPSQIYASTQANIGTAKLRGSDWLEGAKLGFPFPKPESGVEVMWNHRVRYRGDSAEFQSRQMVVSARGEKGVEVTLQERAWFRYGNVRNPANILKQPVLLYYLLRYSGIGLNNFVALVHETANSEERPRAVWVAPPGARKLFRIPAVGYDQPYPGTEGMYFLDMVDMYNGAFDRYVWTLKGKREIYVPYNSYRISSPARRYDTLLQDRFLNPDDTRYELHRVWVVEANERGGKRHSFGVRRFYVDEDSWNVLLVENHDRKGKLWRFQEGHLLPQYDIQAANCLPVVTYDLQDGRYFVNRLIAEEPPGSYSLPMTKNEFAPAAVKARYLR